MAEIINFLCRLAIVCGCLGFSVFVFQRFQIPIEIKEFPQIGLVLGNILKAYFFPIFFGIISLLALYLKEEILGF